MIGTRLGAYDIIEEIGRGGMAVVYRARQESVGRDVAVKVISQTIFSTPDAVERFKREARLVARLEHPHILPLYDFDSTHNPPYLVMRLLTGGTLKEVMSRRHLPLAEVVFLMRQIALALDYAHRQGVIHRDVKPSNVLIDLEGNTFLSDFGIARTVTGDGVVTLAGGLMGTPEYMSPEQAVAEVALDGRTDIYSLGVMLFQMLTGQLPFTASMPMSLLLKHMNEPVPSALKLLPGLPSAVDEVIMQAMAKDRNDRYQTAAEFAGAMLTILDDHHSMPVALRSVAQEIAGRTRTTDRTPTTGTRTEQNRVVTVMNVSAVDYFTLVEEEDGIEAAQNAVETLWMHTESAVAERGGMVIAKEGNRLLAIWGVEDVFENDTERAIRAALQLHVILRDLSELDDPLPLNIGIHTGSVLLTQDHGTYNAIGSTLAVSEKLAESAEGRILVSRPALRDVRGVFDIEPDEPVKLRGRKDRLETFAVLRARPRAFRLNNRGVEGVDTRMIGRDAELKVLQNAYLTALEDEETQVVTVSGGAGVGKSRLLYEFSAWTDIHPQEFRLFRGRATPDMVNTPYAMLRDILSFRFEILDSDPAAVVREKLTQGIAKFLQAAPELAAEITPLIGALAGFDFSGVPKDGAEVARQGRAAFLKLMKCLNDTYPSVFELEDMHYCDDATLDLFNELVSAFPDIRLMILMIARSTLYERRPAWGSDPKIFRRIDLQPLDKRDTRALVREVLQKLPDVPKPLVDVIADRSEGNPYTIEELVKMLIDDRVIVKGEEAWSVELSRLDELNVPPSLVSLLQARLDTLLYPERVVLARASVFGRIFWTSAVASLAHTDDAGMIDVPAVLATLNERGFVYRRDPSAFTGTDEYAFQQAMLRDVTYDSIVERQRRVYHAAAAQWIETAAGERAHEYVVSIADHYARAGENEIAAAYLLRAGDSARRLSALRDAITFYQRAHDLLPDDPDPLVRLSRVQRDIGSAVDAQKYAEKALSLATLDLDRARALIALAVSMNVQGHFEKGEQLLNEALPLARAGDDPYTLLELLLALSRMHYAIGRYDRELELGHEALELARKLGDDMFVMRALNELGVAYASINEYSKSSRYYEELRELARSIGSKRLVALALINLGETARILEDYPRAKNLTLQAQQIHLEVGDRHGYVTTLLNLGDILHGLGDTAAAAASLRDVLKKGTEINAMPLVLYALVMFGKIRYAAGQPDEALKLFGLALSHPAALAEMRDEVTRTTQAWGWETARVDAGLAAGRALDFDATIQRLMVE